MKDLIEKISSYELFNNLLPGILFVVILNKITPYNLVQENIVLGMFFYYFIGAVISRIGSIVVEPIVKKFVTFADYSDYISAVKHDPKIDLLSEKNNMFRTFIAMFMLLILAKIYSLFAKVIPFLNPLLPYIVMITLVIIFFLAYKKQTSYVVSRVEKYKQDNLS